MGRFIQVDSTVFIEIEVKKKNIRKINQNANIDYLRVTRIKKDFYFLFSLSCIFKIFYNKHV